MAYTINKTDGTIIETVEDGTLGTSATVKFIGRNYQSYGEVFNENLVKSAQRKLFSKRFVRWRILN